ncbi:MAG: dihydrofolate reductase [Saprospiraceae bacterium]
MIISCIVAMNQNGLIGVDNGIPWHLPADLQYFKRTTLHHPVLMGRKCYESIGIPLRDRLNIIVTRDRKFAVSGCQTAHSIEEGLSVGHATGAEELFIIGGGEIYQQSIHYWKKLYVTKVDADIEGDTFFPTIDWERWQLTYEEKHLPDLKNLNTYSFNTYLLKT